MCLLAREETAWKAEKVMRLWYETAQKYVNTQGRQVTTQKQTLSFRETVRQNPPTAPIVTKLGEFKLLED